MVPKRLFATRSYFFALLILFLLINGTGCSYLIKSYYRVTLVEKPKITEKGGKKVDFRDLTVGISRKGPGSERLRDILRKTRLFASVDYLDQLTTSPDLIVVSQKGWDDNLLYEIGKIMVRLQDAVPVLLTCGILPTGPSSEEFNLNFNLADANDQKHVLVTLKLRATDVIGGWPIMTPLVLLQWWHLDYDKAYAKAVRKGILLNQHDISPLLSNHKF